MRALIHELLTGGPYMRVRFTDCAAHPTLTLSSRDLGMFATLVLIDVREGRRKREREGEREREREREKMTSFFLHLGDAPV